MKTKQGSTKRVGLVAVIVLSMLCGVAFGQPKPGEQSKQTPKTQPAKASPKAPRPIRIAVFDFDVRKDMDVEAGALTDRINVMLAAMPKVTIVNRDQIKRVAEEHKIALSG